MMNKQRRKVLALAGALAGLGMLPARAQTGARTLAWEDLVPKGWDPSAAFRDQAPGQVAEGSAREGEMMRNMRRLWDEAPTRSELHGANVRLPGYVVPLEQARSEVSEFLLVPYFGACIHSPPPPANQIVLVRLIKPQPLRTMDAVWASGRLAAHRTDSPWGVSGYTMEGQSVQPYRADR
jgi:uncharacterized protein